VNNVRMEEQNERHTRSTLFMLAVCYIFHVPRCSYAYKYIAIPLSPRDARRARDNALTSLVLLLALLFFIVSPRSAVGTLLKRLINRHFEISAHAGRTPSRPLITLSITAGDLLESVIKFRSDIRDG